MPRKKLLQTITLLNFTPFEILKAELYRSVQRADERRLGKARNYTKRGETRF